MQDAESPVQPRISSRHRSAGAIAEIESPAFSVLLSRGGTPLPASELDGSFNTIGALAACSANESLKIVDGGELPIVKTSQRQVAAVALRLDPADTGAVVRGGPYQVRRGIHPVGGFIGALAQRCAPERPSSNYVTIHSLTNQRLATSAAGTETDALLCTLPPTKSRSMIDVKSSFNSLP
jgi:hypothetical protein